MKGGQTAEPLCASKRPSFLANRYGLEGRNEGRLGGKNGGKHGVKGGGNQHKKRIDGSLASEVKGRGQGPRIHANRLPNAARKHY